MFGIINRGILSSDVLAEFENLVAKLSEFLLKEHNEDGTHRTSQGLLNFVPVGSITIWTTATAPDGWVICDGAQVSRLDYSGLFAVIGTSYGAGNGTTTFNLPNLQGKFPLGKAAAGTGSVLGGTGGSLDHTHSGGTTGSDGAHTHTGATGSTAPGTDSQGSHSHGGSTGSEASHTHRMSEHRHAISAVEDVQDGSDISVRAQVTQFDIFDSGSGTEVPTGAGTSHAHSISSDGGHSHTVNSHTHSISSDGSHTHSGGTTGTANPAFIALNYIIFTGVA